MNKPNGCETHHWPRQDGMAVTRTIGKVRVAQCNNCLANKLSFNAWCQTAGGEWVELADEQIIEPVFYGVK